MNITNIIDVVIIFFILVSGLIGFNRGFIKQTVASIGTILIFILAFYLKNPVANFLTLNLPFFPFNGIIKGATALNLILYQLIAFLIVLTVLQLLFSIIIRLSGVVETILKYTIILGIPSKILGFLLGLVEGFVITYIILFFVNQPLFNNKLIEESSLTPKILNSTPILSNVSGNMNNTVTDIYSLVNKYKGSADKTNLNKETIAVMLKYGIIKVDLIDQLIAKDKINVSDIDQVLDQYR